MGRVTLSLMVSRGAYSTQQVLDERENRGREGGGRGGELVKLPEEIHGHNGPILHCPARRDPKDLNER